MAKGKIKLVVTILAPRPAGYDGATGGMVRLGEIMKRIKNDPETEIIIISPQYIADHFREKEINAQFITIESKLKFKDLFGLCLKSSYLVARFLLFSPKNFLADKSGETVAYSSSDLFWEVIPAWYYKIKNKNIRWVQVIHHVYPDWKRRQGSRVINFLGYRLQRFSFRLIRKKADKIIVVNEGVKNDLSKLGFDERKIHINSNGVDCRYLENIPGSDLSYEGIFLGRLSHSKGVFELIDIWKKVCEKIPAAELAMIGGGKEEIKKKLTDKIKENGLENSIKILGYLDGDKAYSILKSGKIFVFPSHEEGWGIAIAEALACGLPVVSWNLPNYRSIFENHIIAIEENDTDLFADKVVELMKDENYRKEIGGKGKEFIGKYSWDNVARKEWNIINS